LYHGTRLCSRRGLHGCTGCSIAHCINPGS
jgi:hypothetical protein